MSIFNKKIGPIVLKNDSCTSDFITQMTELEKRAADKKIKSEIQKQIKYASYGEYGEGSVSFELKNSGMDMYIIHDIYLEHEDGTYAQIDFIVVTRKKIFIIECKNLYGNIEIDENGTFIRNNKYGRESIYSPVTQNQRHLDIIKKIRLESKSNIITKSLFEHYFDDSYKSLIVLANSKTILDAKNAPQNIKEQVIRADQLIEKIKEINNSSKDAESSDEEMKNIAQFFLEKSTANKVNYVDYYRKLIEQDENRDKICPRCGKKLVIKTANKGKTAGTQFYGCPGFPQCRYTESINNGIAENSDNTKTDISEPHIETKEEREKRWENDWLD